MANTIRIKKRAASGSAGAPTSLSPSELAFNENDLKLYYGFGDDGNTPPAASSIITIGGAGAFFNKTDTRSANTILSGPTSGSAAAPTFRSLVAADIPIAGEVPPLDVIGAVPLTPVTVPPPLPAPLTVIVLVDPVPLAVTEAPTKFKVVAWVDKDVPSSCTVKPAPTSTTDPPLVFVNTPPSEVLIANSPTATSEVLGSLEPRLCLIVAISERAPVYLSDC